MSKFEVASATVEHLKQMFAAGKRFDGRDLTEFRPISVTYEVSNCAEGSARVKFGKTEVIVGVKLNLEKPYPDSLDKGNLMVSGDLLPLASPRYEVGPPKFDAIELPRLVDRAIRESHVIDLKSLVVKKGELVWTVIIDVYPINDDGNLIDASILGAIAALKQAKMPGITESNTVDYKHRTKKPVPLSVGIVPLSFSFYKLGNNLIMDPTREEEEASEVRINFGVSEFKGKCVINSSQKTGEIPFSRAELHQIADLLPKKYKELSEKLKTAW